MCMGALCIQLIYCAVFYIVQCMLIIQCIQMYICRWVHAHCACTCNVHICCNAQTVQHEPCKGKCCPVWVLQQICWRFLATDMYEHSRVLYTFTCGYLSICNKITCMQIRYHTLSTQSVANLLAQTLFGNCATSCYLYMSVA